MVGLEEEWLRQLWLLGLAKASLRVVELGMESVWPH